MNIFNFYGRIQSHKKAFGLQKYSPRPKFILNWELEMCPIKLELYTISQILKQLPISTQFIYFISSWILTLSNYYILLFYQLRLTHLRHFQGSMGFHSDGITRIKLNWSIKYCLFNKLPRN